MREFLAAEDIANQVRMLRSHPRYKWITLLLVEGSTDALLFRNVIDADLCEIVPAGNRENAIRGLMQLETTGYSGVLAIVDADFMGLEGQQPASPNILLTDTHDLETMLLQSPALEKVLREHGSNEKITKLTQTIGKDIRTILVECAMPVGYLLWLSLRENLALRFEELDFSKFIDKTTLTLDQEKLIKAVKDHSYSGNIDRAKKQIIMQHATADGVKLLQNREHDPWHICRGHDLTRILSIGLCRAIGTCDSQKVRSEILEKDLRLAFERVYFQQTRLYPAIQRWELANNPYRVLLQTA